MRSFGAAALLALAIVTECLGAHSDRQRQRSGPIRSVPVGADIKRDVSFDCPEEFGYYPHPTDCTLYYVCVFGGALLESCTGGLMYSHELQTCDWPRNVGCDGTSAGGGEDLERISERDPAPPPPPPRRNPPPPPPPPPRAQPNPVVTSRGQPKFNREEYEQQQQLYAEVDDLPPVEEIESDRQQRVYRGQPSTIGQVQKDRDGYSAQVVSSRTLNSNIIPASISQSSGKVGSFSFGTQVDERRIATATQAPQTYSENRNENVTDSSPDRQKNITTNEIDVHDVTEKLILRRKREVIGTVDSGNSNFTDVEEISDRSDNDKIIKYISMDSELGQNDDDDDEDDDNNENDNENNQYDTERGKRQVRYYLKNGYKNPGKIWVSSKPIKFVDIQQFNYNPSTQSTRYQQTRNAVNGNQFQDANRKPYSSDSYLYSTANPYATYQIENAQSQRPFKASLPDPFNQRSPHAPMNVATQIITKSPPISSLKNNENPFLALAGGFFNNIPKQNTGHNQQNQDTNQYSPQAVIPLNRPNNQISFQDSSLLPSTVVTGKPIRMPTSPRTQAKHPIKITSHLKNNQSQKESNNSNQNINVNQGQVASGPFRNEHDYDDEENDDNEDDESSENTDKDENDEHYFSHDFPEPPYEFTHPTNKYADIENPFANPNFDFDTFIAKLKHDSDEYSDEVTSKQPKTKQHNIAVKIIKPPVDYTTASNTNTGLRSSTLSYNGMSTPRPFSVPTGPTNVTKSDPANLNTPSSTRQPEKFQNLIQLPYANQHSYGQQQQQQQSSKDNVYNRNPPQYATTPLEAIRPNLKPPNFKDDRQLPITYSFDRPIGSTLKPNSDKTKGETKQIFTVTQKPYIFVSSTGRPILLATPKLQHLVKPEKIITLHPHLFATGKPYFVSSVKPHNTYITLKQSTSKPLTTLANEQLSALQHYWRHPSTESQFYIQSTARPSTVSEIPKLESLFAQAIRSTTQVPMKSEHIHANAKDPITTSTKPTPKRRPIPKPSPEMNDYYYDDEDEQYYYEPPVKSKYMPSTEVKPQRPPMAQNYQEYEDFEDSEESPGINRPSHITMFRGPLQYKPESATKNHNDVSIVTKSPLKDSNKHMNGKISIPVLVDYRTQAPNVLMRPEISNYEIIHHSPRNRTLHFKRPMYQDSSPYTRKPPKYLNQTTLRPYTVRHRLAKPTTVKYPFSQSEDNKQTRGRTRHPNIVAQMKLTTPRDNHNQETRHTKTKHDDKTNSLEPTESVTPSSYASPRPKMLYNGSLNYSPDQYDPFYAVYDEDGELYKDTDYVQQYNTGSLRPAVQQTYRGTPPPARRPVETYTQRPSQDDYDDALIQGQINNQNQYQSAIRHSTRGEGNELGYDHNPSSVKTTLYEATPLSTTPSTTSTSTTTQRPTSAPFTEAMTPSRYTPRSSTDENPTPDTPSKSPSDGSAFSIPSTPTPAINFSSLAKPFERTDNSPRLKETLTLTEELQTPRPKIHVTNKNNNNFPVEVVRSTSNENERKVVSLTSGFSIRRNTNNTNNPYTLTVLTRPFDSYRNKQKSNVTEYNNNRQVSNSFYQNDKEDQEESLETYKETDFQTGGQSSDSSMRRKDGSSEELPFYVRPTTKPKLKVQPTPPSSSTTKYYLKTVIKRPAPLLESNDRKTDSTENNINTENIETRLRNTNDDYSYLQENNDFTKWNQYSKTEESWNKPVVSPYRALNDLKSGHGDEEDLVPDFTTTTPSTIRFSSTFNKTSKQKKKIEELTTAKPAYYAYRILDDKVPDQTTEVFSATVKNIIKAFFSNIASTPKPQQTHKLLIPITTPQPEEKTVNIGFQKKTLKFVDEKPLRNNVKHVEILTEPTVEQNRYVSPSVDSISITEKDRKFSKDFSSTTATSTTTANSPLAKIPLEFASPEAIPLIVENSPHNIFRSVPARESFVSKFNNLITDKPDIESSRKFHSIINYGPSTERNYHEKNTNNDLDNEVTKLTTTNIDTSKTSTVNEWNRLTNKFVSEIATTTGTTKSTSTSKVEPTSTTKSLSFPTRASRVNPAIKLAASNPGGGRRSYQSSSKCSSDNSLQANPKCNEIKYQRPSSTRGRGSAHYSTLSGSDTPQQQTVNRGTPPTRSRPTLKPSTAVVTNTNPVVDIYTSPPGRPAPVYPQPTPDKTAAKCRKDVCLLPDCYCGGKDIPGELPVESVPQIVLLTFDDSVNDLNKGLYTDLFEKGRVNPNGCPIASTFYVSHEWTDYSQVQNLYSAGHEMASHTVSHSFGEQFSQKKWNREVGGQREILAAYGGVKLEDVRGMRAPFLSVGGNKMFKMLYDSNFTYDSSLPVYENRPPSWPYTLDYKLFHDCMIPPCPTKSYPGVWEVPMVMWQDLNGGRCSMGDACANPPEAEGVYKMLLKNFDRHYTTNRAPFGLYYHAAWFTQPHHKAGFIMFLDFINQMSDVWIVTNWQALQWVRDPTPISRLNNFQPFQCNYQDRPKKCNNPKVCNLWHKSGVRYMRTCQPCPEIYPWTGKTGIRSSRIDNDIEE